MGFNGPIIEQLKVKIVTSFNLFNSSVTNETANGSSRLGTVASGLN